jgi:hemin uptake protein HemP
LNNSKLDDPKTPGAPSTQPLRTIPVDANRIDSRDLFVGTRELTIGHGGETYRLRLTAQNKLILTK